VYLGARVSSRAPDRVIRPLLVVVLTVSALKLIGASNIVVLSILGGAGLGALVIFACRRAPLSSPRTFRRSNDHVVP
jgi:hypothetical protein